MSEKENNKLESSHKALRSNSFSDESEFKREYSSPKQRLIDAVKQDAKIIQEVNT